MAAPVAEGTILAGKYRVDKVLGEGGMGVVVAATDTQLERRVAIKFLLPEYAQHHEASQRFMREARAAVKIKSEHIARVIDVSKMDNGSPYMVMEYLEGGDLSQVIKASGPVPTEDAVLYLLQACEAIAEAHSYGIVHRDLKPANLFLARQPDGTSKVKVLDFGISKMTVTDTTGMDNSLTRTSSVMGSPLYMSPEQMRSTRNVDARTDIWALGIILYELLSGRLPFNAESVHELSAKILLDNPEPLSAVRPDLPAELEWIVMHALQKDPEQRYPTISEFALSLLPFAPRRAQHNVERITRVMQAAGLSASQYSASVRPPSASLPDASMGATVPATTTGAGEGTEVNFGSTNGPKRSSLMGVVIALGAGVVVLTGAVLFFVVRNGTTTSPEAELPVGAASDASAVPVKVPEPAESSGAPPVAVEVGEGSSDEAKAEQAEAEKPEIEEESPAPAPEPAPKKVATVTKKRVVRAVKKAVKTEPKPASKPTPKEDTGSSLRSRFGSRK